MFKNEEGFSLLELVVAVGVAGIIAAVALPTFAGLQQKATDNSATYAASASAAEALANSTMGLNGSTGSASSNTGSSSSSSSNNSTTLPAAYVYGTMAGSAAFGVGNLTGISQDDLNFVTMVQVVRSNGYTVTYSANTYWNTTTFDPLTMSQVPTTPHVSASYNWNGMWDNMGNNDYSSVMNSGQMNDTFTYAINSAYVEMISGTLVINVN